MHKNGFILIHSFIFDNQLILVRLMVDLDPWKDCLDGI